MSEETRTCRIACAQGEVGQPEPRSVDQVLAAALDQNPHVVWREPALGPQEIVDFRGLWVRQQQDGPLVPLDGGQERAAQADPPKLAEARVFWENPAGGLHLLANGEGATRWSAFWETNETGEAQRPAWLTSVVSSGVKPETLPGLDHSCTTVLTFLRHRRKDSDTDAGELIAHEYRRGLSTVFWRLQTTRTEDTTNRRQGISQ